MHEPAAWRAADATALWRLRRGAERQWQLLSMSALVEWRVACTPGAARCAPLALARSVENLYEQYTVHAAVESHARSASAESAAGRGPGEERPGHGPPRQAACEGRAVPAWVPTDRTMPPGYPPPSGGGLVS